MYRERMEAIDPLYIFVAVREIGWDFSSAHPTVVFPTDWPLSIRLRRVPDNTSRSAGDDFIGEMPQPFAGAPNIQQQYR